MEFNRGDYTILKVSLDTNQVNYIPIGCLTSNGLEEIVEMIATTVRTNEGGWNSYVPGLQDYTIDFEGLIPIQTPNGQEDYFTLTRQKRQRKLLAWEIDFENGKRYRGQGYIETIGHQAPVGDFVSFAGTIRGSGKLTDSVEEETNQYIDRVQADGGDVLISCTQDFIKKLEQTI